MFVCTVLASNLERILLSGAVIGSRQYESFLLVDSESALCSYWMVLQPPPFYRYVQGHSLALQSVIQILSLS